MGIGIGFGFQTNMALNPDSFCLVLGRWLNLSELQFPYLLKNTHIEYNNA